METVKIEIQNEQEKKVLLAFLKSLNYRYILDNDAPIISDEHMQELARRKADLLSGKTSSLPWTETK